MRRAFLFLGAVAVLALAGQVPVRPAGSVPARAPEPSAYGYCQQLPSYCADGEEPAQPDRHGNGSPPPKPASVQSAQLAPPQVTTASLAYRDAPPGAGGGAGTGGAASPGGTGATAPGMTGIRYSVLPHPDDDGSDAVLTGTAGPGTYNVYVVLTNGENSGACFGEAQADDADYDGGQTDDGDNDLSGIGPDSSSPADPYPNPGGPYWYAGPSDPSGYPAAREDSNGTTSYVQLDNGEYWPGSGGTNTTIDAWTGKALPNPGVGPYPAAYPDDPAGFSSLGGCREARLAALENMAQDLELHNGVGADFPDAGYDNYAPNQVCFSGVPTYWNGSATTYSPKDPCAYAWIGAHGAVIAFNLGDLNQNWDNGDYPTYENWGLSPQDVLWALRAVAANKASIGLPALPDLAFVDDAWYNATSPGGSAPQYTTSAGGPCDAYGHWNHYAVADALYNDAVVAGVPDYGRTCSGDPRVGPHGIVITPDPSSPVAAFNAAFYSPPSATPYDTYSARQYGFEVGGYFGWNQATTSKCGTGASIEEGEWSCDEAFWASPATGGP